MTEFRHDPNSLANRLDQLLPPGQPDQVRADGDPLVEVAARIASAPRPMLSPDALAQLQTRVMQAQPLPLRAARRIPASGRLALVASLTMLLIAGAVFAARELGVTLIAPGVPTATSTPTSTPTMTPTLIQSATPVTPTSAPPTETVEAPLIAPTTVIITETSTAAPASATPPITSDVIPPADAPPPTALPVTMIVEGPVQVINSNIITIYDINITINAGDPLLAQIQVGDFVRVEGDVINDVNSTVVGVNVFVAEPDVIVGNNNDIVWQDDGNCGNPPPPWAPAHGWRTRCEGAPRPGNSGNNDRDDDEGERGRGMGDDD